MSVLKLLLVTLFFCSAVFASPISAQSAHVVSTPGRAVASVVDPISVVAERPLNFGQVVSGSERPVAILAIDEGQGIGGGAAKFRVAGTPDRDYQIAVQAQVVAVGQHTGEIITVSDLTVRSENTQANDWSGKLDTAGRDTVFVGGTLRPSPTTRADLYRADVMIQVSYN